ncbi:MAG: hypothetical protein SPK09_05150, partial [Porphyromonas sp.]|nr:hypothetical protein [Porphyromonas sp.]
MFPRLLSLMALALLSSCSLRQYQGEGDILYTGIREISVAEVERQPEAEQALLAAEEQLAYKPNNSLFGSSSRRLPLPLYRPYLYLRYANAEGGIGKWLHRLGSKPVWIRDVNPSLRAKITERVLGEHGYLRAQVRASIHPDPTDSLQAKVSYHIEPGALHRYDSISYLPPMRLSDSAQLLHAELSRLRRGQAYNAEGLIEDRNSVSSILRESGYYYFNPSYIVYEADTLQVREQLQLRTRLREAVPREALRQWRIGDVRLRFLDNEDAQAQSLRQDTLRIDSALTAYYTGRIPLRRKTLNSRVRLRPDSLYCYGLEDLTIKSLASTGAFSSTELFYTRRSADSIPLDSVGIMDMTIVMRRDKPWSVSLGAQLQHKTTGFVGPTAVATLGRRNIFGGGE